MVTSITTAIAVILIIAFVVAVEKTATEETWIEEDPGLAKGDYGIICHEIPDGIYCFSVGEEVWVTGRFGDMVEVSSAPDECVLDSNVPGKFARIPEAYVQQGKTVSGFVKGDIVELKEDIKGFSKGQQIYITQIINTYTVKVSNLCDGCIDRNRVFAIVPEEKLVLALVNQKIPYLIAE